MLDIIKLMRISMPWREVWISKPCTKKNVTPKEKCDTNKNINKGKLTFYYLISLHILGFE
jgi:hypothetical protein